MPGKEQHQENSRSSLPFSFSPCSLIKSTKTVSEMLARRVRGTESVINAHNFSGNDMKGTPALQLQSFTACQPALSMLIVCPPVSQKGAAERSYRVFQRGKLWLLG